VSKRNELRGGLGAEAGSKLSKAEALGVAVLDEAALRSCWEELS